MIERIEFLFSRYNAEATENSPKGGEGQKIISSRRTTDTVRQEMNERSSSRSHMTSRKAHAKPQLHQSPTLRMAATEVYLNVTLRRGEGKEHRQELASELASSQASPDTGRRSDDETRSNGVLPTPDNNYVHSMHSCFSPAYGAPCTLHVFLLCVFATATSILRSFAYIWLPHAHCMSSCCARLQQQPHTEAVYTDIGGPSV